MDAYARTSGEYEPFYSPIRLVSGEQRGESVPISINLDAIALDGKLLELDIFLRPGGMGPPEHIHLLQTEHFRVMAGMLAAKIDGQEQLLNIGQEAVVPAGTRHTWWNAGDDELQIRVTLELAANFEGMITEYFDLVNTGKLTETGPVD